MQNVCLYASSVESAGQQTALEGTIPLYVAHKASLTFSSLRFHARELRGFEAGSNLRRSCLAQPGIDLRVHYELSSCAHQRISKYRRAFALDLFVAGVPSAAWQCLSRPVSQDMNLRPVWATDQQGWNFRVSGPPGHNIAGSRVQAFGLRRCSLCCSLRSALGLGSWLAKVPPGSVAGWVSLLCSTFGDIALQGNIPQCTFAIALKSGLTSVMFTYVLHSCTCCVGLLCDDQQLGSTMCCVLLTTF